MQTVHKQRNCLFFLYYSLPRLKKLQPSKLHRTGTELQLVDSKFSLLSLFICKQIIDWNCQQGFCLVGWFCSVFLCVCMLFFFSNLFAFWLGWDNWKVCPHSLLKIPMLGEDRGNFLYCWVTWVTSSPSLNIPLIHLLGSNWQLTQTNKPWHTCEMAHCDVLVYSGPPVQWAEAWD